MKIKAITLDELELPESMTVEMTRAEATLIAGYVGGLTPNTPVSSGIWDALTGTVFNRFWEDGLRDAQLEATH